MAYLEELLPEFRKGAKIRMNSWDKEKYIFYTGSEIHDNNDKTVKIEEYQLYIYEWEFYQEPIGWDYIIENKCLCWFWSDEERYKNKGILVEYHPQRTQPFIRGDRVPWENWRPVRRDEVTFYEDKKDEIWTGYAGYERGKESCS